MEALLQTVRKTQVSIGGGERASGPGKRTFLTPGRQEGPNTALWRSLLADCSAAQHFRAWPGVPGGPQNSVAASLLRGSLLGATMQLGCGCSKTSSTSFPRVPWA